MISQRYKVKSCKETDGLDVGRGLRLVHVKRRAAEFVNIHATLDAARIREVPSLALKKRANVPIKQRGHSHPLPPHVIDVDVVSHDLASYDAKTGSTP
jgi:hypothetical protein